MRLISVPVTDAMAMGTIFTDFHSPMITSMANTMPAMGALKVAAMPPAAPQATDQDDDVLVKLNASWNFNANNMASGVYFYKLDAEGQTATKKMMLLK